jgi:hypothetical protein
LVDIGQSGLIVKRTPGVGYRDIGSGHGCGSSASIRLAYAKLNEAEAEQTGD